MQAPGTTLRPAPTNGHAPPLHGRKRDRRVLWLAIACALAAIVAAGWYLRVRAAGQIAYITSPVTRKDLVHTVTATGTVNPQNTILVGTQVSGTITEQDADYNDVVKSGQVLTRLDPTSFQAALDDARAAQAQAQSTLLAGIAAAESAKQNATAARAGVVAQAQALASAKAQVAKTKAALDLANVTLRRDGDLLAQGFISQSQFDADRSSDVAAKAADDAARIAVNQAEAQLQAQVSSERAATAQAQSALAGAAANRHAVDVQRAAVAQARYNFDNTVIRSQVKGTVIARNITIGQTVAASFQTPTLFTIGQDLAKMEVDVAVGEPDIGGVRAGDIVDFTVLAYPNRTFSGYVYQVRQNPTTVNNVVTYDTVVYVDNKDGALYPGMTANSTIHVAKVMNALVVPISALQWSPPQSQRSRTTASATSPWGMTDASLTRTIVAGRTGRLFVWRAGKLTYVAVNVLLVSDTEAAVKPAKGGLNAGDPVVVSDTASQMASQQAPSSTALTSRPPSSSNNRQPGGR